MHLGSFGCLDVGTNHLETAPVQSVQIKTPGDAKTALPSNFQTEQRYSRPKDEMQPRILIAGTIVVEML